MLKENFVGHGARLVDQARALGVGEFLTPRGSLVMSIRRLYLAVPTALVAALGLAWLTSASAFDGGFDRAPRLAQAAPPAAQPPAAGGGADRRAEHMHSFSPKAACEEHIARRARHRAYLRER